MTTRTHTFTNAINNQNLFLPENPLRTCFTVFLSDTEDSAYISDQQFQAGVNTPYIYELQPGEIVFFSAFEGHNVTKPFYIISTAAGNHYARVYEEVLDDSIMDKLKEKGIDSTQGLPLLLLGLLATQ